MAVLVPFSPLSKKSIVPDIVTVAKGLGAGYQPIGAAIVHDKIYQAIAEGSGFFQHGHTFMGHPMACAAALATVDTIVDDGLLDNVKLRGKPTHGQTQRELRGVTLHRGYPGQGAVYRHRISR